MAEKTFFDNWYGIESIQTEQKLWNAPFFADIIENLNNPDKIEEIINQHKKTIFNQYIAEHMHPEQKAAAQQQLNTQKEKIQNATEAYAMVGNFINDIAKLSAVFPPEKKTVLTFVLTDYLENGTFSKELSADLTAAPKGLFNRIKQGKQNQQANACFEEFKQKYTKNSPMQTIGKLDKEVGACLTALIRQTANLDFKGAGDSVNNFKAMMTNEQNQINNYETYIQNYQQKYAAYQSEFENSVLMRQEETLIRNTIKSMQEQKISAQPLNVSDYVEGLDNIPDDEPLIFNFGLIAKNPAMDPKLAIENVLLSNGIKTGTNADEWLLRQEQAQNSDNGRYELFSPIISAKEAKEILPKIMSDLDRLQLSAGLVIPMRANDVFKDTHIPSIPQPEINAGLENLLDKAYLYTILKEDPSRFTAEEYKKFYADLGISSKDELPKTYTSLEQIKQAYPKEEYLFNGTMASDDYCAFSARTGRNGTIYATPHADYAVLYDGAQAYMRAQSATGDNYINTEIGQASGKGIRLGFINIYEQNQEDKFYADFGMEDARKPLVASDILYDVCESPDKVNFHDAHKQMRFSGARISKDEALNGFISRTQGTYEIDGKTLRPISHDSETFVTPEKNPMATKIMHIQYGDYWGGERPTDLYIEVPQNPDKFISQLLSLRQADMQTTFNANNHQDIYERFCVQKKELEQRKARSSNTNEHSAVSNAPLYQRFQHLR